VGYAAAVKLYTCVHAAPKSPSEHFFHDQGVIWQQKHFWQLFGVDYQAQATCAFSKYRIRWVMPAPRLRRLAFWITTRYTFVVEGLPWCTARKACERKTILNNEAITKYS
jgi:hypothetical protein